MSRVFVKLALGSMFALLIAVAPARCDSVPLVSSTGGAYIYDISFTSSSGVVLFPGDTLVITGLSAVTEASTPLSPFSASSTSTTATLGDNNVTVLASPLSSTIDGILTIDSTSTTIGTVHWELSGPGLSSPVTGTTEGPVSATPEPCSLLLLFTGLLGLGSLRRRFA